MSNENIVHVEAVEGLLNEASNQIDLIVSNYPKETMAKEQVLSEINDLQTGALHALRILCEGD